MPDERNVVRFVRVWILDRASRIGYDDPIAPTTEGGTMITHAAVALDHIALEIDNALDDMHDDGISDKWVNEVATHRSALISLITLRHAMTCSHMDEPLNTDNCDCTLNPDDDADSDYDMHFLTCRLTDWENACSAQISDLVYCDLIRPRWEKEPLMTEPGHIARD